MSKIITVRGPIEPQLLGLTSMHDHIMLNGSCYRDAYEQVVLDKFGGELPYDPETIALEHLTAIRAGGHIVGEFCWDLSDVGLMSDEVAAFKQAGGSAIVDVTTEGLGRNAVGLRQVAEASDVHIVASTGFYDELSWPDHFHEMDLPQMTTHLLREIEKGIDGAGVKPGMIKTGANQLTETNIRGIRAAARAAAASSLSLTVHNGIEIDKTQSWAMLQLILAEGVDPQRIIWAHTQNFVNDTDLKSVLQRPEGYYLNLDFAQRILDQGVTASIDCFGNLCDFELLGALDRDDKVMIMMLAKLLQEGYASQLVIGHDVSWKPSLLRYGGHGYTRIPKFVLPALREAGYGEALLDQISVKNPIRLLAV